MFIIIYGLIIILVTIYIKFKDVLGSHDSELLKGKIRDKKLKELLK